MDKAPQKNCFGARSFLDKHMQEHVFCGTDEWGQGADTVFFAPGQRGEASGSTVLTLLI